MSARPLLLDASALMAFFRKEPGWEVVAQALTDRHCLISSANVVEAEGKLVSDGTFTVDRVRRRFGVLTQVLEVVPFPSAAQHAASFYYARRRPYNLSLGDALCLATAEHHGADALTAESAWASLPDLPIQIQVIR